MYSEREATPATTSRCEDLLKETINTDSGAAYLGELGIGTNYQISQLTRLMLLDEKIGGTIHVALGEGFPETGGKNISGIHWDMVCDLRKDEEILVDDEIIFRSGKFLF